MKDGGATLLELMVVLAVSAILLTVGIPGFATLVQSTRLSGTTNALLSSLHLARSEAIKRNARAAMCPSITGTSCAGSGGWHQGWIVFHDANNNAARDAAESVILRQPAMPEGFLLTGNTSVSRYISYSPTGSARMISGAFQAGTLTACRESPARSDARQVIISSTGRPRTVKKVLASCP
jgi:type IV fimbrial biogenesis protein FimT